ncbi:hypothetical protein BD626DRAFT_223545 [Schizophyllum amplum]|uniref:Survival Motor Neuron Gemin2-binding domain-containing protein n=1 Tax=Schizophyllum amplum TaxID=97359 RepID=A0A550BXA6_9AGAR|nr:hypothetical protein BD626DRAFT_223545 [Auriculariopsis ampla]
MALRPDPRASRPVLAYDDISLPYDDAHASGGPAPTAEAQRNGGASGKPPPAKKRKGQHKKARNQHWDDPGNSTTAPPPATSSAPSREGNSSSALPHAVSSSAPPENRVQDVVEESRELTYEEIWDDSALIDAWDAANQEYEAYHGKGKSWKDEPIRKWYNVPPAKLESQPTTHGPTTAAAAAHGVAQNGLQPLNYDTFVASHDASLGEGDERQDGVDIVTHPPEAADGLGRVSDSMFPDTAALRGLGVTQDDAFSRAMNAMYWTGYWTAVYHSNRGSQAAKTGKKRDAQDMEEGEEEVDEEVNEEEAMDDVQDGFVSSQR